jgi:hypothetical protein
MNAHLPVELRGPDLAALCMLAAGLTIAQDLDRGDFLAHVREEVELSRSRLPAILQPVDVLYRAVDAFGLAMRQAGPDAPSRCAVKQRAAELAALVVRLATEGTPVFPATMPGQGR